MSENIKVIQKEEIPQIDVTSSDFDLVENYQDLLDESSPTLDDYKNMLTDERIGANFDYVKTNLLSIPFQITPFDDSDKSRDMADFIENNLTNLKIPFDNVLDSMIDGLVYGYSIAEKVFKLKDGKWYLDYIKPKDRDKFTFKYYENGNIQDVIYNEYNINETHVNPLKMLISSYPHQWNINGAFGESLLDQIYDVWKIKKFLIKYTCIGYELTNMPVVIAEKVEGIIKKESQKTDLKNAIKNIFNKHIIQMPAINYQEQNEVIPAAKISLLEPKNSKGVFDAMVNFIINIIHTGFDRIFFIPQDLLDKGGGSYAKADAQKGSFGNVLAKWHNWLEGIIKEQIIKQLIDLNFSETDIKKHKYPDIKFREESKFSSEKVDYYSKLITAGIVNAKEPWIRSELGIEEAPEDMQEEEDNINDNQENEEDNNEESDNDVSDSNTRS